MQSKSEGAEIPFSTIVTASLIHLGLLSAILGIVVGRVLLDPIHLIILLQIVAYSTAESFVQKPSAVSIKVRDPIAVAIGYLVGIALLLILVGGFAEKSLFGDLQGRLDWFFGAGLLSWSGMLLRLSAIAKLGPQFNSDINIVDEQKVCSEGIYRWMKHPGECGFLMLAIGTTLQLHALWTSLAACAILIPISLWRMRRENKFLAPQTFACRAS